jgi:hypothetical protein
LRDGVASTARPGTPQPLPEAVGVDELVGADRQPIQFIEQPEGSELLHGVRQKIDADAEFADGARRLVDLAVDADRMQAQGRGQAADAAADDQYFHGSASKTSSPRPGTLSAARYAAMSGSRETVTNVTRRRSDKRSSRVRRFPPGPFDNAAEET